MEEWSSRTDKDQLTLTGNGLVKYRERFEEGQEAEICAALLHDVLEDTNYTVDNIRAAGMNGWYVPTSLQRDCPCRA